MDFSADFELDDLPEIAGSNNGAFMEESRPVQQDSSPKIATPMGVFKDMSNADYHASGAISKSGLDKLAQSPAHLWYYQQQGCESTKAMDFGSLFHDLVLMGSDFVSKFYKVMPDFYLRSQAGRDEKEQWLSRLASWQTPVTQDEWAMCVAMRDSVMMHPYARALIEKAQSDVTCENSHFWVDEETFNYTRIRPDFAVYGGCELRLCDGRKIFIGETECIPGDLKSTIDCTPNEFKWSMSKYRYHVQDQMYRDGIFQTTGFTPKTFLFLATEKKLEKPVTAIYYLNESALSEGNELYRANMRMYAELMEQDDFMQPAEISMPIRAIK